MARLKFIQPQLLQTYSNILKRTKKRGKLFSQRVPIPMCQKTQRCQSGERFTFIRPFSSLFLQLD